MFRTQILCCIRHFFGVHAIYIEVGLSGNSSPFHGVICIGSSNCIGKWHKRFYTLTKSHRTQHIHLDQVRTIRFSACKFIKCKNLFCSDGAIKCNPGSLDHPLFTAMKAGEQERGKGGGEGKKGGGERRIW